MEQAVENGKKVNGHQNQTEEHDEVQYLNLIRRILKNGIQRGDRTGVGTIGVFGTQMRFNLRNQFPLLTTKRVFWRAVAEELLWFVKGSTDARLLQEKNIRIWDGNSTREFLDASGFKDREVSVAEDNGNRYAIYFNIGGRSWTSLWVSMETFRRQV